MQRFCHFFFRLTVILLLVFSPDKSCNAAPGHPPKSTLNTSETLKNFKGANDDDDEDDRDDNDNNDDDHNDGDCGGVLQFTFFCISPHFLLQFWLRRFLINHHLCLRFASRLGLGAAAASFGVGYCCLLSSVWGCLMSPDTRRGQLAAAYCFGVPLLPAPLSSPGLHKQGRNSPPPPPRALNGNGRQLQTGHNSLHGVLRGQRRQASQWAELAATVAAAKHEVPTLLLTCDRIMYPATGLGKQNPWVQRLQRRDAMVHASRQVRLLLLLSSPDLSFGSYPTHVNGLTFLLIDTQNTGRSDPAARGCVFLSAKKADGPFPGANLIPVPAAGMDPNQSTVQPLELFIIVRQGDKRRHSLGRAEPLGSHWG